MNILEAIAGNRSYSLSSLVKCSCGGSHVEDEHWKFVSEMPQDPIDLIDDFVEMGLYSDPSLSFGESLSHAEMKADLIALALGGTPEQKQICGDLIGLAGGVEEALAAAFGPYATEFMSDAIRASHFRRRDFLIKVAAAAAVVTLTGCPSQETTQAPQPATGKLEKSGPLSVGFISISCASPLIMAQAKDFYKKHGLEVNLVKMKGWPAVRDSIIAGELDAYHMLSPMPIAMTVGLGSVPTSVKLACVQNNNGDTLVLANKHKGKVKGPADFKGLEIGVPFVFSIHNLLLRYYVATGGLNPDKDLKIIPMPPPEAISKMTVGQIDGFLLPNSVAQVAITARKIGFLHLLSKDLWSGHPCCAFGASQKWIDAHPNTFRALTTAVVEGSAYANDFNNREEVAQVLAKPEFLGIPEPALKAALTGQFDDGLGNKVNAPDSVLFEPFPWQSFAKWIMSQMVRWRQMPKEQADYDKLAQQIYLTDLVRDVSKGLGLNPPAEGTRVEKLKFDTFDPANPEAYIQAQIAKFKV
ncbi:CmpA/NrtA family ABC transporter substrate-binding protein [Pseudanabaena sp. PCC 6802]|uniref:CmpA/NrtA family ABC transporter substrate-binding protein n=1 Tax=Pseudanabaena sp. PCC 6802 TaxID=118173 RepID=UPI00034B6E4C|nr:CmpA/NrtA family ABC transporter substrate-binding protein [Pseudanabaena sp. PCC 6802]